MIAWRFQLFPDDFIFAGLDDSYLLLDAVCVDLARFVVQVRNSNSFSSYQSPLGQRGSSSY
jgi:hypothetical protein